MAREIKFRAYSETKKMMGEVLSLDFRSDMQARIQFKDHESVTNEFRLMQATGLKDKNGKEIYEGDILKQDLRTEFGSFLKDKVGQMIWHPGGQWLIEYQLDDSLLVEGACSTPEIIGNIYQNPELLKR